MKRLLGHFLSFVISAIVVSSLIALLVMKTDWLDCKNPPLEVYIDLGLPHGMRWSPPGVFAEWPLEICEEMKGNFFYCYDVYPQKLEMVPELMDTILHDPRQRRSD